MYLELACIVPLAVSALLYPPVIRRLKRAGITGTDLNKPHRPDIPEMGGIVLVLSFTMGILATLALYNFTGQERSIHVPMLLAGFGSVLLIAILGVCDDLLHLPKPWKLILPIIAALPLVAVQAGVTSMKIPFIGSVDFGIFYLLLILPIGMTGAANGTNILGGFNGLEAGLGLITTSALAVITYGKGEFTALLILVCMIPPLAITLVFNWLPARIFLGDVGTLPIGAILCIASVFGNCEMAGAIIMIPHAIDFLIKARHRFPSRGWEGDYRGGRLFCPKQSPVGLCQLIMKLSRGITETRLVLTILGLELLCAAGAVALYS